MGVLFSACCTVKDTALHRRRARRFSNAVVQLVSAAPLKTAGSVRHDLAQTLVDGIKPKSRLVKSASVARAGKPAGIGFDWNSNHRQILLRYNRGAARQWTIISAMGSLYAEDLVYIQTVAFGGPAQSAAPEVLRRFTCAAIQIRRIVDVGCGAGPLTAAIVQVGFEVTGIDKSAELLAIARAAVPRARFVHKSIYDAEIPLAKQFLQ